MALDFSLYEYAAIFALAVLHIVAESQPKGWDFFILFNSK